MSHSEEAGKFPCGDATLLGIISVPDSADDTGVVVIVGGPQYRVGSHRQFVLLARSLADAVRRLSDADVRERYGAAGRRAILERYNWEYDTAVLMRALDRAASLSRGKRHG